MQATKCIQFELRKDHKDIQTIKKYIIIEFMSTKLWANSQGKQRQQQPKKMNICL